MSTRNRKASSAWLNTAALLMATSCLTPVGAFAACAPNPVTSGSTVVCTGTDTAGIGNGTQNDVKVSVSSGDSIQSGEVTSISLADRANVVNSGFISGSNGISVGDDGVLQNKATGQIDVSYYGIIGNKNVVVLNQGTINSDMFGVSLYWDGKLTNDGTISVVGGYVQAVNTQIDGIIQNNGTIVAKSTATDGAFGFVFNADNVVTNDGIVQVEAPNGAAYGIYGTGGGSTLINNDTFTVTGNNDARGVSVLWGAITNTGDITVTSNGIAVGVQASYELDFDNSGTILVTGGGRAIGYSSGRQSDIVNSGKIIVEGGEAGSVGLELGGFDRDTIEVVNSGTIKADIAITAFQNSFPGSPPAVHLNNTGLIDGDIKLYVQSDEIANMAGGKIIGAIDLGGGADTFINNAEIVGGINLGDGDDVYLMGSMGSQSGGPLTGGEGFDFVGYYADGVQSAVLALSNGFEAAAVYGEQDGAFTISGATQGNGLHVLLMGAGSVINEANLSVSDVRPAVVMEGDGLDFQNKGSVEGPVAVQMAGNAQSLTNWGTINGSDQGISAADGNAIVNHENALIASDGTAIALKDGNNVVNFGSIASQSGNAIDAVDGQTIINQEKASVVAGGTAVNLEDGNTVVNRGTITSQTGNAVNALGGNDILNAGTINAMGSLGVGIAVANNNGTDLNDDGYAGITNTGTINSRSAGISGVQFGTITNAGTITSQVTGIIASNNFMVRNLGTINANNTGMLLGTGNDFVNEGQIHGGLIGLDIYYEHTDDIDGDGDVGVINEGLIDSTFDGVVMRADNVFENRDTVEAGRDGIVVVVHDIIPVPEQNTIRNSGVVTAGRDAISIAQGESVIENSGTLSGVHAIFGGDAVDTITNSGVLDGAVDLRGGGDRLTLQDGSVVKGDIDGGAGVDTITSAGNVSIDGKITGVESLSVSSGNLFLDLASGSAVGEMFLISGNVNVNGAVATKVTVAGPVSLSGTAAITGPLLNNGTVAPGNSIGTLAVNGNYTQGATGDLFVELGSSSADKLAVAGVAALDGTLSIGLVGTNLAALEGRSYSVLTAGSTSGAFDNTGTIQEGFWTLNIQQTGTAVTVTVTDVDLTIGASVPVTSALASAITAAAPASSQDNGVVIDGHSNTVDVIDTTDQAATSLSYDSLGDWEATAPTFVAGWSDMGARTSAASMPKTGTAAFEGTTKGELTETGAPEAFVVEGNVMLTANFASGLVNADFTEMEKIDSKGVASAWVDFRARMSIADGTSEFAGTADSGDGVWRGEARGGFYGDEGGMPSHAAGLWSMSSPLGSALGGFMAKRQ